MHGRCLIAGSAGGSHWHGDFPVVGSLDSVRAAAAADLDLDNPERVHIKVVSDARSFAAVGRPLVGAEWSVGLLQ